MKTRSKHLITLETYDRYVCMRVKSDLLGTIPTSMIPSQARELARQLLKKADYLETLMPIRRKKRVRQEEPCTKEYVDNLVRRFG